MQKPKTLNQNYVSSMILCECAIDKIIKTYNNTKYNVYKMDNTSKLNSNFSDFELEAIKLMTL